MRSNYKLLQKNLLQDFVEHTLGKLDWENIYQMIKKNTNVAK